MTIRYSTEPVALDHAPGSECAVVAGSYYDDEPAVWCRILSPGRNRDYRAVIVEPGDRQGKMVFIAAPAGPDRLQELVGHLVLVDLEREKDRVCFGAPAKMALASLRDGVPGSTCRPDLRPCAAAVDSVQEAESRLLADMDAVLMAWLRKTARSKASDAAAEEPGDSQRNKRRSNRRRHRLGKGDRQVPTVGA
ncbi:MAG TPA: hypothetical protein PLF81_27170 [Candidatus Anammoximicrobium sp.]|nr:hypothetical protein [Candidatus Anammoximicrobium sp.]